MNVKEYVLSLLQKKYTIPESENLETFNYMESGYIDSLGIIQFVAELEDAFAIEFTDEELTSQEFKTVGGIVRIIDKKKSEERK